MNMKVFINTRIGSESGGMILVAANTKEEAISVYRNDEHLKGMWRIFHNKIEDYYYEEDGWEEMPALTANVDKPQVLAEDGYSE